MTNDQTIALYHPLLQCIALKVLRCKADAEDIVQDTYLKWLSIDQTKIQNTRAYLIRAVTHNCLNHLNTLRRKKEEYIDMFQESDFMKWFKEIDFSHLDLEHEVATAFRLICSKLEPLERAIYLLKEVFNVDYESLQLIFNKNKEHCRQVFCRAKKKLFQGKERENLRTEYQPLFESFRQACRTGQTAELISRLQLISQS